MVLSRGRPSEAAVDLVHSSVTPDQDRGRVRLDLVDGRQKLGGVAFVARAGEQQGEGNAVGLSVGLELGPIALGVTGELERESDNLQSTGAVGAMPACEDWGVVVAVGTPRSEDVDQDNLVSKARILVGYRRPGAVGKREAKPSLCFRGGQ